jgi:23S rRNA (adenine2503-C2)-methyltransferase
MEKTAINNLTYSGINKVISAMGEPAYRAAQVFKWLFANGVHDFDSMTNLSRKLIEHLKHSFYIGMPKEVQKLTSRDNTIKLLFRLKDDKFVECVIIPKRERTTICLSTQVGCKFKCKFCASGLGGFSRNLTISEILNQIAYAKHALGLKIDNYVFMGMGEPLDNYENLIESIRIMNDENAFNIGARRITISTCGITPFINKLSSFNMQVNLSLSLHAVSNEKRSMIMPVNRRYPLEGVIDALAKYSKKTGRMLTLEYVLIPGFNNKIRDAEGLINIAQYLKAKINLIPYSPVESIGFKAPVKPDMDVFLNRVRSKYAHITVRDSRGKDIQAACGQLALKKAV